MTPNRAPSCAAVLALAALMILVPPAATRLAAQDGPDLRPIRPGDGPIAPGLSGIDRVRPRAPDLGSPGTSDTLRPRSLRRDFDPTSNRLSGPAPFGSTRPVPGDQDTGRVVPAPEASPVLGDDPIADLLARDRARTEGVIEAPPARPAR